jgi:hypothetical protein
LVGEAGRLAERRRQTGVAVDVIGDAGRVSREF